MEHCQSCALLGVWYGHLPPQGLVRVPVVCANMFAVFTALRLVVEGPAMLAALPAVPSGFLGLRSVMSLSDE